MCSEWYQSAQISFEPGKAFIRHLHKSQTIIEAIFWTSCQTCFSKFYQHPSASSISHLEMSWVSEVASRTLAAPPKCRSYCRQQWPARASAPHGTLIVSRQWPKIWKGAITIVTDSLTQRERETERGDFRLTHPTPWTRWYSLLHDANFCVMFPWVPSVLVRMWILDRNLKMSPHRMLLADCTALEAMPKIALTHPRILASSTWPIWQNNHYCSQLPIEWKLPIWGSLAATLLERHSRMIMKLASNLHKSLHRPHSSFQFFWILFTLSLNWYLKSLHLNSVSSIFLEWTCNFVYVYIYVCCL